jgi:glutamate synthase domain-containing protein 2
MAKNEENIQTVIRHWFYACTILALAIVILISFFWLPMLWFLIPVGILAAIGIYDIFQRKYNILRNYPIWGHWRYILLSIRPMIQAYFVETNLSGRPFSKEQQSLVVERATQTLDAMPFGTQHDVKEIGYEWMAHSLCPTKIDHDESRITVGGDSCTQPYSASRLNVSAMSYGALSKQAVRALNLGAKMGDFYQNTGEGGLSHHHLAEGGDIVWQIGTANFGCRLPDGNFDPAAFKEKAAHEQVKMIEIKLSQGAKPSHGGLLLAAKISPEIAEIRGIPEGKDCLSPPTNPAFSTPTELMNFVKELRELSNGKPVGFKLCVGRLHEFMAICKAMLETKILPDFITVDGSEGGTGAAPVEFSNRLGTPLNDALIFVNNCLTGIGIRDKVRIIASGKVITGFDMAVKLALGADICNCARGMLFSIGCVQSRRCHNNTCPTGITTQDPARMYALNIKDKAPRVHHFHEATIESFLEVVGAAGIKTLDKLTPHYIYRRISEAEAKHYDEIYQFLKPGQLLSGENLPEQYIKSWKMASAETFEAVC